MACRYIVREGLAADTIVTVGHEEGVDMIVMYTDGRDGLADMLIGSITERACCAIPTFRCWLSAASDPPC